MVAELEPPQRWRKITRFTARGTWVGQDSMIVAHPVEEEVHAFPRCVLGLLSRPLIRGPRELYNVTPLVPIMRLCKKASGPTADNY
jgi:hypothetical protein